MATDEELARRKQITFAQAEGVAALPTQLKTKEISKELRAYLWAIVHESIEKAVRSEPAFGTRYLGEPWLTILRNKHLFYDHEMIDEFSYDVRDLLGEVKQIYSNGSYVDVFDFTQWLIQQENCPYGLAKGVAAALRSARAAYTIYDGNIIAPIGTAEEADALVRALRDTTGEKLAGPKSHLKTAAQYLTAGKWADSIRESIHAVESTAKIIEPSATADTLGKALKVIASKHGIHSAMLTGFNALYGFTSDEQGIRHSLLEKGDANVDEVDAQYMLGACASFVSYLLARARERS